MRATIFLLFFTFTFGHNLLLGQVPPDGKNSQNSSKISVQGKLLTLSQLRRSAKPLPLTTVENPKEKMLTASIVIEGTLTAVAGEPVLLVNRPSKKPLAVTIQVGRLDEQSLNCLSKSGRVVRVLGLLTGPSEVTAYAAEMYPPKLQWQYKLRVPERIEAGTEQRFFVDCVVKNTGEQRLQNVQIACRLWQDHAPNDELKTATIKELAPGQTRTFSVEFDVFNYQYIGKTSVPKCEFAVIDFDS